MTKAARLTQSQVERAIKAAKRLGASAVEVKPDGTIRISLAPVEKTETDIEPDREIVL